MLVACPHSYPLRLNVMCPWREVNVQSLHWPILKGVHREGSSVMRWLVFYCIETGDSRDTRVIFNTNILTDTAKPSRSNRYNQQTNCGHIRYVSTQDGITSFYPDTRSILLLLFLQPGPQKKDMTNSLDLTVHVVWKVWFPDSNNTSACS